MLSQQEIERLAKIKLRKDKVLSDLRRVNCPPQSFFSLLKNWFTK